jgi:hypothetical protein
MPLADGIGVSLFWPVAKVAVFQRAKRVAAYFP